MKKEILLVEWEDRYALGIPQIDEEHKELLRLTNKLYDACREGDKVAGEHFKEIIHQVVEYINYHFSIEEKMLENISYPKITEHKKQHEIFVRQVLSDVSNFEQGKSFVPNAFVRFLRDWILEHIALVDKEYVDYIMSLKKEGKLNINAASAQVAS